MIICRQDYRLYFDWEVFGVFGVRPLLYAKAYESNKRVGPYLVELPMCKWHQDKLNHVAANLSTYLDVVTNYRTQCTSIINLKSKPVAK